MTLVKFNHPLRRHNVSFFDQFFADDFLRPGFQDRVFGFNSPAVNVVEGAEDYRIEMAAPGLNKADFKMSLEKDVLTIKVQKETTDEQSDDKYLRREYNFQAFERSFQLPKTIDQEQIAAKYENGVLSVSLPKRKEALEKAARDITVG
ncbi:MAG: hypothetical protein RLZZ165_270 [Bacteroidota bacterium]|jgi:HSP20 family protein